MGPVFALITAACWAAYNIAVRKGMQATGSGAGYVVTLAFGAIVNLSFLLLPLPGRLSGFPGALPLLYFIVGGMSTTLLGRWVYFQAIETLGPSRASAWKNASPVYTLVFGAILLGEIPGMLSVLGTLVACFGLILLSKEQSRTLADKLGTRAVKTAMLYGIGSGMAFSAGMLVRRAGLLIWPDAALGSAIGGIVALLLYLPYGIYSGEVKAIRSAPAAGIRAFLWAGVFSSLALLFTFLALSVSATATAHVIASVDPIFTMLLSSVFLGRMEGLGRGLAYSAVLVCLGAFLMTM